MKRIFKNILKEHFSDNIKVSQSDYTEKNIIYELDKKIKKAKENGKNIAFFDKNGILTDVFPRDKNISLYDNRQVAYSADYLVMNNIIYDLHNASDVEKIELPEFIFNGDVTSGIEYIMYMHRGNEDNPDLELAIINKTFDLMVNSEWWYTEKNFVTLAICLMKIDRFDKADELYNKAMEYLSQKRYNSFHERIQGHDLIVCSYHENTCEICSKYQGRVYSVSGKDKRFPKLPDVVLQYQGFHPGCRHTFFPYYYPYTNTVEKYVLNETGEYVKKEYDAVEYSNRPFIDDRTEEEKRKYIERLQKEKNPYDYNYAKEHYLKRQACLKEYNLILEHLPECAPKSYSGYARMKTMNTKNFQNIVRKMKEKGFEIE